MIIFVMYFNVQNKKPFEFKKKFCICTFPVGEEKEH